MQHKSLRGILACVLVAGLAVSMVGCGGDKGGGSSASVSTSEQSSSAGASAPEASSAASAGNSDAAELKVETPSWETQDVELGGMTFKLPADYKKVDAKSTDVLYLFVPGDADLTQGGSSNITISAFDNNNATLDQMKAQLPEAVKQTMTQNGATDLSEIEITTLKAPCGDMLKIHYSFTLSGITMSQTMYYPSLKKGVAINVTQLKDDSSDNIAEAGEYAAYTLAAK